MLVVILMDILALELMWGHLSAGSGNKSPSSWERSRRRTPTGCAIHERAARFYRLYTCGDYSVATKRGIVKILHFRQFYKHFVFVEDADGGRKKLLKNYADVNVCIDMVCGDTKTDFERED